MGKAFYLPVIGYGPDKLAWHRKADIWREEKEWYPFIFIMIQPVALLSFLRLTKSGWSSCCCTIIMSLVIWNTIVFNMYFFLTSLSKDTQFCNKCYFLITDAFCFLAVLTSLSWGNVNNLWIIMAASNQNVFLSYTSTRGVIWKMSDCFKKIINCLKDMDEQTIKLTIVPISE